MAQLASSRELVRRTLEFDSPSRVPRQLWKLPWAVNRYPDIYQRILSRFPPDLSECPSFLNKPPKTVGQLHGAGEYIDEWGNVFENLEEGIIGEVKRPFLKDWGDVGQLQLPVGRLSVDIDEVNTFCRQTDKFCLSPAPRPFETLQFLRGTENMYMDIALEPPELWPLLDKIHEFFLQEFEVWAQTEIDALVFQDDWGSQKNLLISPELWRQRFKPLYADYVELAHSHGKFAFMHSDGNIESIYPDLVDIGLDAINSQLFCMDIERLGREFGGKITFWGEIDRQGVLHSGTTEEVIQAVERVHKACYHNGGVIAQCSFGVGVKPENVYQVFETWEDVINI